MQDMLRVQPGYQTSVNFVMELCVLLERFHPLVAEGAAWLAVVDQVLDTVAELCQGCLANQDEALAHNVVRCLNGILTHESSNLVMLARMRRPRTAALAILAAMLELSGRHARRIAAEVARSLHGSELYVTMNRLYYAHVFVSMYQDLVTAACGDATLAATLRELAFDCYFVLARLTDLTGISFDWPADAAGPATDTDITADDAPVPLLTRVGRAVAGAARMVGAGATRVVSRENAHDRSVLAATVRRDAAFCARVRRWVAQRSVRVADDVGQVWAEYARVVRAELAARRGPLVGAACDRRDYFRAHSASIEFSRGDTLQKVYFVRPAKPLSKDLRAQILLTLDRSTPQSKVRTFMERFDDIRAKIRRQRWLARVPALRIVRDGTAVAWKWAGLTLSAVINAIMLSTWQEPDSLSDPVPVVPAYYTPTLYVLGVLHVCISLCTFAEHAFNDGLLRRSNIYYVLYTLSSVLGLVYSGYFYGFHFLHVAVENDSLQRAFQSIVRAGRTLFYIVVLVLSVMYIYSIIGFAAFRGQYDAADGLFCDTLYNCFLSTVTGGIRSSGGIGDRLLLAGDAGELRTRWLFDMTFWALVCVICMNLILGVILDSFSELRGERDVSLADSARCCFVCSLPSHVFAARGPHGFRDHVQHEHNMWNYLYYADYLDGLAPYDRTYNEAYLHAALVVQRDPAVFPVGQAMSLHADHAVRDGDVPTILGADGGAGVASTGGTVPGAPADAPSLQAVLTQLAALRAQLQLLNAPGTRA